MSESDGALIDIVEPAVPMVQADHGWVWIMVSVLMLLLVAILGWLWWKHKLPAFRSVSRMRVLRRALEAGFHTPQESILMLALELRHGLGVKRLLADRAPEKAGPAEMVEWAEFMRELDELMYGGDASLDVVRIGAFYQRSEFWIRRYGRKSAFRKMEF